MPLKMSACFFIHDILVNPTVLMTNDYLLECRLFIEQLAEINPVHLNDDARLAFWINLYNALLMHVSDCANSNSNGS